MEVTQPADVHAPIDTCPQCGARLVVMRGDGFIETTCGRCGYAVRQHPARRIAHEPYELGPVIQPSTHPFFDAIREKPRPRRPIHKAWLVAWTMAVAAIATCVVGIDDYWPIYLASLFLTTFGAALAVHRVLYADRKGQPWPEGVTWHMTIFVSACVLGYWLAAMAPSIGEPNYCPSTTADMLTRQVPHTFRCTEVPAWFAGFVGGFWLAGWLAMWLKARMGRSG